MHAFNALAGKSLLQAEKVTAFIEEARQEHSSLAAATGPRGFTTAAINAYLGTFASLQMFMGRSSLQYIHRGTSKQNILNQLPPGCDRFIIGVRKGTGLHSYSHAICMKYSHQSHAWYLIDSENTGPALLNDDEWLQICGGIRVPYLGQSGDIFEEAHHENSDANRQEIWLDLQQQPLHFDETINRSLGTRLEIEERPTQARRNSRRRDARDTAGTANNGVHKVKKKPVNTRKMKDFSRVKERTTTVVSTSPISETSGCREQTEVHTPGCGDDHSNPLSQISLCQAPSLSEIEDKDTGLPDLEAPKSQFNAQSACGTTSNVNAPARLPILRDNTMITLATSEQGTTDRLQMSQLLKVSMSKLSRSWHRM